MVFLPMSAFPTAHHDHQFHLFIIPFIFIDYKVEMDIQGRTSVQYRAGAGAGQYSGVNCEHIKVYGFNTVK